MCFRTYFVVVPQNDLNEYKFIDAHKYIHTYTHMDMNKNPASNCVIAFSSFEAPKKVKIWIINKFTLTNINKKLTVLLFFYLIVKYVF